MRCALPTCLFIAAPLLVAAGKEAPPVPVDPASWITSDDYPMDAAIKSLSGVTALSIAVNKAGSPTSCTITSSSGSASLDDTACAKIMERGHFLPARDAKGKPVSGSFTRRIVWRLPDDDGGPIQLRPNAMTMTFWVEPDGSITDCQASLNGKNLGAVGPCVMPFGGKPVAPVRDAAGNAVRQKYRMSNSLERLDK
jgi:protein TonB